MPPARSQWGATLGDAWRRFWRRSATVARRPPQSPARNDERSPTPDMSISISRVCTTTRSSYGLLIKLEVTLYEIYPKAEHSECPHAMQTPQTSC